MAWYPKATKREISRNYSRNVTTKNAVILHSSAAESHSLYDWFMNPGAQASAHFHVAKDGTVEQYIDTKYMSWASASGNPRSISIETQGCTSGHESEPWTDAQMKSIIALVSWIVDTHDIPKRLMESSATTQHGIGWHRLGIDGNFPTSGVLRGRSQRGGGEVWSSARGKVCPGDGRIKQMSDVLAGVEGKVSPAPAKPSKPSPKPSSGKAWPAAPLPITDKHTAASDAAWHKLMRDIGYTSEKKSLTTAIEQWLRKLGYYHGRIDTDFGPVLTEALQTFLHAKGLYKGLIDGKRGPMTIHAEIAYLNTQMKFYK